MLHVEKEPTTRSWPSGWPDVTWPLRWPAPLPRCHSWGWLHSHTLTSGPSSCQQGWESGSFWPVPVFGHVRGWWWRAGRVGEGGGVGQCRPWTSIDNDAGTDCCFMHLWPLLTLQQVLHTASSGGWTSSEGWSSSESRWLYIGVADIEIVVNI